MEDESMFNCVPSFARGFNLLLVHDNTISRVYLSSLLELYSFKVTATNNISAATSMICHDEGEFKLVMAKANMSDVDTLSFLDVALKKDIPVIVIYAGEFDDVTWKALGTRLCYFLQEPIRSNDLKYVWQHVYHSKAYSAKKTQNAYFQDIVYHAKGLQSTKMNQVLEANGERNHEDNESKLKRKRTIDDHTMSGSLTTTQCQVLGATEERNHDNSVGMPSEKGTIDGNAKPESWRSAPMSFYNHHYHNLFDESKRSITWTPELHLKFTEAIHVLGENMARPKQILSMMNEPHLTVRQVASHLQKHRSRLKRKENARNPNLPPVSTSLSYSHKAKFPLPFEQSTSGAKEHTRAFDPSVPTPKASLNENHNQNQFLVNNIGAEESNILSVDKNQHATEYNDLINKFAEDSDNFDLFESETNPGDVDQYSEMLRTILDGSSSSPW